MKTIAFDCDGTLRDYSDNPRNEVIGMLRSFKLAGYRVIVWSGGGLEYARNIVQKLKLQEVVDMVCEKNLRLQPDITVDDQVIKMGKVNIQVDPAWRL